MFSNNVFQQKAQSIDSKNHRRRRHENKMEIQEQFFDKNPITPG
jgi:hypothetical protein